MKKLANAAKVLASGMIVYVAMAACSASDVATKERTTAGGGGAGGEAGMGGVGGANPTGPLDGAGGAMIADASTNDVASQHDGIGSGGASGANGTGGTSGAGGSRGDASLLDRIVNPVPDADAQTGGSRLKARHLVAADGARQFWGWRDTQRNEDCSFMNAADGQMRCLPTAQANVATYWADAGCTQQLAFIAKPTGACVPAPAPTLAVKLDATVCPTAYRLYGLGAKSAAPTIYLGTTATCTSTPTPTTYDFYALGTEIPATSFVAGSFVTDP